MIYAISNNITIIIITIIKENYEDSGYFLMTNDHLFFILLQGPEVGDVSPLLIQPSSQTLAGKNNSFFKWYINLQSTTISMTFSNKPSVQSTEFQTWSCHIDEQQKSAFFE